MITISGIDIMGAVSSTVPISVGNSSAISYTITSDKKGVFLENLGTKTAWWGGATVDPGNNIGGRFHPGEKMWFRGATPGCSIYFLCDGTDTTTIGVNEYEDT